jgi:hypothetical protein
MRTVVVIAVMLMAGEAEADRLAPHATQQAVSGCWDVGQGATLTLRPFGRHSVVATARFKRRPRGGPAVMREPGRWDAGARAYVVPCRPRSQHGTVCLVQPTAGGLAVTVIGFGAGGVNRGAVESFVAPRC